MTSKLNLILCLILPDVLGIEEALLMEAYFSKEVQAGLDLARVRTQRKKSRLRIEVNGVKHPVLRRWKTGFAMAAVDAPQLRGYADLFDGPSHLFQCLIIAHDEEDGEVRFEFKRATPIAPGPALDFEKSETAPVALIGDAVADS
jgi:hypothetical protein